MGAIKKAAQIKQNNSAQVVYKCGQSKNQSAVRWPVEQHRETVGNDESKAIRFMFQILDS